jgi:peptidoglycan hydrolase CwlO-like protein
MKKTVILIFALFLAASLLYAQDDQDLKNTADSGSVMTKKAVAGFSVLTAEDAQVTNDGKMTYVEDIYSYTGRKFKAIETRLKNIESAIEELDGKIKDIEKRLHSLENTLSFSREPATPPQTEPAVR